MPEQLNPDELNELMNDGESVGPSQEGLESAFGQVKVVPIPAIIYIKIEGEGILGFDAQEAGSWAYTPLGIFAGGHWVGADPPEYQDVLFPYEQVHHLQFMFPAPPEIEDEADEPKAEKPKTKAKKATKASGKATSD